MKRLERPPRVEKSAWVGIGGKPRVYTMMCPLCRSFCHQRYTESELIEHQRSNHANCLCCYTTFGMSRNTLRCSKGHHLCHKCSKHYIKAKCASKDFPFLCSICREELDPKDMTHMMTSSQLQDYDIVSLSHSLAPNEILFACQNTPCRSACILALENCRITKSACPSMIPCRECDVSSCFVCLGTEKVEEANCTEVNKKHFQCMALLDIKTEFDQAIADGAAFKCPQCQRGGRKDERSGCNSIYCDRCGINWCYICHRALSKSHNCSFHLHTYNFTLEQLHRHHTRLLLHGVYCRHGAEKFNRLWEHFPSVRAHGFILAEIVEGQQVD